MLLAFQRRGKAWNTALMTNWAERSDASELAMDYMQINVLFDRVFICIVLSCVQADQRRCRAKFSSAI
jgi:hypothetical protein